MFLEVKGTETAEDKETAKKVLNRNNNIKFIPEEPYHISDRYPIINM